MHETNENPVLNPALTPCLIVYREPLLMN
jgi:hypothetical protein